MSDPGARDGEGSAGRPLTGDDRKLDARLEALGEELKARGVTDEPPAAELRRQDAGQRTG